jgi:hypothetical protein
LRETVLSYRLKFSNYYYSNTYISAEDITVPPELRLEYY